jgi:pilus assembly protein Flp/PilA
MRLCRTFLNDENGATAVEYAVMLALILASCIAGIGAVGASTGGMWGGIQKHFADNGL